MLPVILSYVLSFVYVGLLEPHHLFQSVDHVNGAILWANLHLLFWLSLFPFVTGWMGENHFATWPVALYGVVLLMAAVAYYILVRALIAEHGRGSTIAKAVSKDYRGLVSIAVYALAVPLAFVNRWIGCALYVVVALMWLVPDPRIEKKIRQ